MSSGRPVVCTVSSQPPVLQDFTFFSIHGIYVVVSDVMSLQTLQDVTRISNSSKSAIFLVVKLDVRPSIGHEGPQGSTALLLL